MSFVAVLLLSLVISISGQSLLSVISEREELSQFAKFYSDNEASIAPLISESSTNSTVLVPNNNAFTQFESDTGGSFSDLPLDDFLPILKYHLLVGSLTSTNFTAETKGFAAPSKLKGEQFNNRSAGPALANSLGVSEKEASGQVVFISGGVKSESQRFRVRRQSDDDLTTVKSGLSSEVNLDAIDLTFEGGRVQEIDGFLTIPGNCKSTITNAGLDSLDTALSKAGLWDALNFHPNVTCLGPNNKAFSDAGNPESELSNASLSTALLFHTIEQPLYTNFLEDGQEFRTLSNSTIRVTISGDEIFFNDAKVVSSNLITNNGLVHELDKVMSPIEDIDSTSAIEDDDDSDFSSAPIVGAQPILSWTVAGGLILMLLF